MSNTPFPYRAVGLRIIVLRDPTAEKSEGGILLTEGAREVPLEGTVVAVGAGHEFDVGDRVVFTAYSGIPLKVELAGDYLVLLEEEVLCAAVRQEAASASDLTP